jgi:phosphonate transport system permease protein
MPWPTRCTSPNFSRGDSKTVVAVEGERTATYDAPPEWVRISDDVTSVDLGGGYHVEIIGRQLIMDIPDYGSILVKRVGNSIETQLARREVPPGMAPVHIDQI